MHHSADYNRVLTLGIPEGLNTEDEVCPCGTPATFRTCVECGVSGWIIDCGHYAQPRPLAAGRADGSNLHYTYCCDCA